MTLLIIFCLLILYNFIKGTFQFESVTKTSFIIIPLLRISHDHYFNLYGATGMAFAGYNCSNFNWHHAWLVSNL